MSCMFSLDRECVVLHETLDLTPGNAETSVFETKGCSTMRVDLIFSDPADVAAASVVDDPVILMGDLADGSDGVMIMGPFEAMDQCDPADPGSPKDNLMQSYELCPCKVYHKVQFPNAGAGSVTVIARASNCRTNPPSTCTAEGTLGFKLACPCAD